MADWGAPWVASLETVLGPSGFLDSSGFAVISAVFFSPNREEP
jgi:hypothetical protein